MEIDLSNAIVAAAKAKGVGVFKTEAQVEAAIRFAIQDVMRTFTSHTRGLVPPMTKLK